MVQPIDIEGALQAYFETKGISAAATPFNADLGAAEPAVAIQAVGGQRYQQFRDDMAVSIDCYAPTWEQAMTLACECVKHVTELEDKTLEGRPVYRSEPTALPYDNPNPWSPEVPRVTFTCEMQIRIGA